MFSRFLPKFAWLSFFLFLSLTNELKSATPTLDALFPAGIQAGTTTQVVSVGKSDPWPSQVSCSNPQVTFKPDPKKKGTYSVTAKKTAASGPCFVRLYNKDGASKPMIFVVGKLVEAAETVDEKGNENNDSISTAEKVKKLPVTINGRLIKSEDIDIYRVTLKKGQTLIAHLDGYGLRAPMDPYLHLYDPAGSLIILGNDNGKNIDPLMVHKVQSDGDYTVAVMAYAHPPGSDIRFTGKTSAVYRLTLTTGPWLSYALPLAVKNTGNTALKLFGHNLPGGEKYLDLNFTIPAPNTKQAIIRHPAFPNQLTLPITAATPAALKPGSEIKLPAALSGQLAKAKQNDTVTLTAKKGQKLDIQISSQRFAFPLDPLLSIQNDKGKELKSVDDTGVKTDRDVKVVWTCPADGKYTLRISDLFLKGGPHYHYLLRVKEAKPSFSATFEKNTCFVEAGKNIDVKIKIVRINGHKSPLVIEAKDLPAGISIVPPKDIPNKNADITVKIKAAENAAAANRAIQFSLKEKAGDAPVSQSILFSFLPKIPGGPYLLNQIDHTWLTVKAKDKPKPKAKTPAKPAAKPDAKKTPEAKKTQPKPKTAAKPAAKAK